MGEQIFAKYQGSRESGSAGKKATAIKQGSLLPTEPTWYTRGTGRLYFAYILMNQPRTIKVFVASPSDVVEERNALAKLIADTNDVLAYLAPEKSLTLELVRYETHSYPDLGAPQEVINREIPVDYDIFIGIMWKRIGTATATDPSGTVEEFHRACERRKHGSLPRIMFYFCDQPVPIPEADDDLEQLRQVIKFRKELDSQGLTSSYPSHAQFAETVRGGLLRATRDILHESERLFSTMPNMPPSFENAGYAPPAAATVVPPNPPSAPSAAPVDSAGRDAALKWAREYDRVRASMPSSSERTRAMEAVFSKMKILAPRVQAFTNEFEKDASAGVRLLAIAVLDMFPNADHLDWLAERLDPEREQPFVAYHASVALLDAVTNLPPEYCSKLKAAIAKAQQFAPRLEGDSSRLNVLTRAQQDLKRKCPEAKA